ncbi:hybrid sensor histidine kinase/response regulator [Sphingobacterium psychroaquaticum]|uniref:histidine kinase n=1 Tax=Sphingobacterium psychroaquaticum TaxID=561061 RepID=A0A1X7L9R1_9SPHI|nr:response regulator [Sphingobacterium psychroaquaticum]SMG50022.1 Signal transduction histidine kinase [Sphingobacterium psychroaquaticum]
MRKETIQRWNIFISILVAYLIVLSIVIYFFNNLVHRVEEIRDVTEKTQIKISALDGLNQSFQHAMEQKSTYFFVTGKLPYDSLSNIGHTMDGTFMLLKKSLADNHTILPKINKLDKDLQRFLSTDSLSAINNKPTVEKMGILSKEHDVINREIIEVRKLLVQNKSVVTKAIFEKIDNLKKTGYVLVTLPFLFILFIFYRILQIFKELSLRSKQTHLLNKELQETRVDIENSNWILQESSKLNEALNGVDNEDQIAKISFNTVLQSLDFYAGTIYIRKSDSHEYHLKQQIGIDKSHQPVRQFVDNEGLLGHVTEQQEIKVIAANNEQNFTSSTSLTKDAIKDIILVPLVYEHHTFGLIEIGGDFADQATLARTLKYLLRISRTIAVSIKFGQSRTLVENLLEETQQQTEELEAQQEELRITNEELIYKTNLLEASEEELRVQQEELQQSNTELEDKAKQLEVRNEELNVTQRIVEEKINEVELASKYKSEFMANMSHELRTPLNSILILAKLLQDNKTLNPEQIKYASVIHSAGSDLLQLINELLDLAKIESGKVELNIETVNIKDFVNNLDSLFQENAREKEIDFTINVSDQVPASFITDEYRLEQVVKNFISNAFKFTDKKGKIEFNINADDEHLRFIVKDNGKGISAEKQDLIFEAFHQEDGSTSRKYGGTGLGLSISREIASLLGGRITLDSTLGEGSTFTLIIPHSQSPEISDSSNVEAMDQRVHHPRPVTYSTVAEKTPAPTDQKRGDNKTLLIVEDDNNFADILKNFAEEYGFNVMLAHDGAEAIEKAKAHRPHAVILDVMLPISDGWEVLRTLKGSPETKHIPVHMMSGANFNQRDFIESGAIGFLSKPMTEESLKKAFENINLNIREGIKKVLLIEDQEFQSQIIKSAFAEKDINVIQAFSAQTAMHKLDEEDNIDCIILDIKLPDANGFDLLDEIKALPKYQETPIIINTASELTKEQLNHVHQHTKAMIVKSSKSNNRLIDEVNLFLNKISSENYSPVRNMAKLDTISKHKDSLSGKRVLIADDDMRNVFALTTVLQAYDMEIEIANNGLEALEIVNNNPELIDIILMDIMMPEMDGYEAISKIRENPDNGKLPIIAVTAKAMKGDREKSIQMGANDYISKPIDIDKLVSLMRVWLS